MEPVYGVYLARVESNDDPEQLGRVCVVAPRVSAERLWARVTTPPAAPNRGAGSMLEAGDEVLVAFEAGDPQTPYVLGSLWSSRQDRHSHVPTEDG